MQDITAEPRGGGAWTIWLDDPDRRNAFGDGMMGRLANSLERLIVEPDCRVIVVRGRGGHFCAGRALSKAKPAQDTTETRMAEALRLATTMNSCPKPLVALVEGWAVGVGISLLLWADIAIADSGARFSAPEVRLGIPPTMTAISLLRRARRGPAMEYLLTGRKFSAAEALDAGVIARVAPDGTIDAMVDDLIGELSKAHPTAVAIFKQLVREADGLDMNEALALAARTSLLSEGAGAACAPQNASPLDLRSASSRPVGAGE